MENSTHYCSFIIFWVFSYSLQNGLSQPFAKVSRTLTSPPDHNRGGLSVHDEANKNCFSLPSTSNHIPKMTTGNISADPSNSRNIVNAEHQMRSLSSTSKTKNDCVPKHSKNSNFYLMPEPKSGIANTFPHDIGNSFLFFGGSKHILYSPKAKGLGANLGVPNLEFCIDDSAFLFARIEGSQEWEHLYTSNGIAFRRNSPIYSVKKLDEAPTVGPVDGRILNIYRLSSNLTAYTKDKYLHHGKSDVFGFCPYNEDLYFLLVKRTEHKDCFKSKLLKVPKVNI